MVYLQLLMLREHSNSTCYITRVSKVLALHCNDIISFSTDPDVFKIVSDGFYGFKGSELIVYRYVIMM